jgi:hypothetical protein
MPYGTLKADTLTYYTATGDVNLAISGIALNGAAVVSGVSGIFTTVVSGATVTGNAGQFTTITGGTVNFANITGVSGTFTTRLSGAIVTGNTAQFTTATAVTGVFTTSISGATVTGDLGLFNTISGNQVVLATGLSIPSGSASSPSISVNGDPNTGLYSPGADQVAISTNGTGRLFVDASGSVGVGVAGPNTTFHVAGSATINDRIFLQRASSNLFLSVASYWDGSTNPLTGTKGDIVAIGNSGGDGVAFVNGNTERMRLTSTGLGIGTTSPSHRFNVVQTAGGVMANFSNGADADFNIGCTSGVTTIGPEFGVLALKSVNTERARIDSSGRLLVGTSTTIDSDSNRRVHIAHTGPADICIGRSDGNADVDSRLGSLRFYSYAGSTWQAGALIEAIQDAASGNNDKPTRLVFSTTADGASSPTERMRIAQNGVITIQNGAVAVIGTLTDGATITPDFAADCNFTVTLGGARTIANPTNITAGQSGSIFLVQDGTGGRTVAWGSFWDFPGGTAPTLSTAANAVDRIDYVVRTSTSIHTVFTANYS